MKLNLKSEIYDKNLSFLKSLSLGDNYWNKIIDCDVMPLDLVNLAFPRFENKNTSLEYLINSNVSYDFESENDNLKKVLSLLDGFDVHIEDDLDYFNELRFIYTQISSYEIKMGLFDYFDEDKKLILYEMKKVSYLSGEIGSEHFNINLNDCYKQLREQKEILAECLTVTNIDHNAGIEMFLENSKIAQEYSDPDYLPVLKEKAKRVGNFICSAGYDSCFD